MLLNPFPNGKILDLSKFKAFTDDKINVFKSMIFVLGRVESIVGNAGYRHFLLFPQCFQKPFLPGLVWERLKAWNLIFCRAENTKGNGENSAYQHFPFFQHCFHFSLVWVVQTRDAELHSSVGSVQDLR